MCFKIDCTSLQLEGNLLFLLCFILYSRANSKYKSSGAYIRRGDFSLCYEFGGLIFGEANTWWGLFAECYCIQMVMSSVMLTTKSS